METLAVGSALDDLLDSADIGSSTLPTTRDDVDLMAAGDGSPIASLALVNRLQVLKLEAAKDTAMTLGITLIIQYLEEIGEREVADALRAITL